MRCIAGFVLFVVLYLCSLTILGGVVHKTSGRAAEAEVIRKYHALVAVGAGVAALFACSLPTLLARADRRAFERLEAEWKQ